MSQADKLLELLIDGQPHSTVEIQRIVYGGEHLGTARIASRVTDLRERGYVIDSAPGKVNKTVWWYKLTGALEQKPEKVEPQKRVPVRMKDGIVYRVLESDVAAIVAKGGVLLRD